MLHRTEQPSKRERKHGRFLELDRPTHLERGSPGCADMVAHLADPPIRAALDVVIEYAADLLAREKVHKPGQMAKIEDIFQKAWEDGFRGDTLAFGLGRHLAEPE